MEVGAKRKAECSERDRQCDVESCRTRRISEGKAFVADMGSVGNRAEAPGGQAPELDMDRRHWKHDANEGVQAANEQRHTSPWLSCRSSYFWNVHVVAVSPLLRPSESS